jgi:CxxC-x17-CxxC domain-containing protein
MFQSNDGGNRQMFKGNWKCGSCGAAISELPFQPDPARESQLQCRDCHRAKRDEGGARERKPMFEGNWTCSRCGGPITQLPFQPNPNRLDALVCRSCFKK